MKVGDVMRVRMDQNCTSSEACGCLCVVEEIDSPNKDYPIRIRVQGIHYPVHYTQTVGERHLEKP